MGTNDSVMFFPRGFLTWFAQQGVFSKAAPSTSGLVHKVRLAGFDSWCPHLKTAVAGLACPNCVLRPKRTGKPSLLSCGASDVWESPQLAASICSVVGARVQKSLQQGRFGLLSWRRQFCRELNLRQTRSERGISAQAPAKISRWAFRGLLFCCSRVSNDA